MGEVCRVLCGGSVLCTGAWVKCVMYYDVGEVCSVRVRRSLLCTASLREAKCVVYCVG